MSDPNTEKEVQTLADLEIVNTIETSAIRLEGQALEDVLSQIDRPAVIQ